MKPNQLEHETWLDLSKAAEYLGVHYTTLRRWADAGKIACIRTPGGRRRFSASVLEHFVQGLASPEKPEHLPASMLPVNARPLGAQAIDNARVSLRSLSAGGSWMERLSAEQRQSMRGTGDRLVGLLLLYNSSTEGSGTEYGEVFIEEGKRILGEYGRVCRSIGMSITETVNVFLFFRRSMLDAIYQTGSLGGCDDDEGQRLFLRTTDFLDVVLVGLIDDYLQFDSHILENV